MEASTVYYTDFRCPVGTSLTDKLRRLCIAAGIKNIDMEGRFVAIKMHFGELGNLAYLRPNYAKVVADLCKEQGGMPFLTDCNTLYPGSRKNALEHLTCAQLKFPDELVATLPSECLIHILNFNCRAFLSEMF